MSNLSHLLALERAATDADLAWRQAKANRFLEHVGEDGQYHQAAFKELDADEELIELEREARYLKAELKVEWNRLRDEQKTHGIRELATRERWWVRLLTPSHSARIEGRGCDGGPGRRLRAGSRLTSQRLGPIGPTASLHCGTRSP